MNVNPGNIEGNIDGGADTEDKIFLLNSHEIFKYFGVAIGEHVSNPSDFVFSPWE